MGNRLQSAQTTMRHIERNKKRMQKSRQRRIREMVQEKIQLMTAEMEAEQSTHYLFVCVFVGLATSFRVDACYELVRTLENLGYYVTSNEFEIKVYLSEFHALRDAAISKPLKQ